MRSGRSTENVLAALTKGGEVRRKTKINMVDQNQESRKVPEQIKRDLLELWRKRALSNELYKAKEETESEILK